MYRRVVFALPAMPLSGNIVAYGPDAAPPAKPLAGAPRIRTAGETAPPGAAQRREAPASPQMLRKVLARTRW